jgi:N-methylhydantoinase B
MDSKFSVIVPAGDVISLQLGGGGGYGTPLERDPAAVLADVRSGRISRSRARSRYGVVITPDGRLDGRATLVRRTTMADASRDAGRDACHGSGG